MTTFRMLPRETQVELYSAYKLVHQARINALTDFRVGDKVTLLDGFKRKTFSITIEKIDLDHHHGSFNGVDCGHTPNCYSPENIECSIVAYTNDGKLSFRDRVKQRWLRKIND